MIYSSPDFILLCLLTWVGYILFPQKGVRLSLLLVSSLLFISWSGLLHLLVFLGVVTVAWIPICLSHTTPARTQRVITWAISAIGLNLIVWKYLPWIYSEVSRIFPVLQGTETFSLPLPLGISFFTLQGIAFLIDFRRNQIPAPTAPLYLLFKGFFAQLVAGPIVRHDQLMPQLQSLRSPQARDCVFGLSLFVMGMAKKLLIADRISPYVDTVFATPSAFNRTTLCLAALGYTVQIWGDFSGYTDMGRGAARLFGFHLPENFLSPYFSIKPSEFWRRWHITLSQWIRDYLYTPLALAAHRKSRWHFLGAVILTMVLVGLWHGANWTFVVFGFYHGSLLVLERGIITNRQLQRLRCLAPRWVTVLSCWLLFFFATVMGMVLFRSESIAQASEYFGSLVLTPGDAGVANSQGFSILAATILTLVLHAIFYYSFIKGDWIFLSWFGKKLEGVFERSRVEPEKIAEWVGYGTGAVTALIWVATLFFRSTSYSPPFIYFQF